MKRLTLVTLLVLTSSALFGCFGRGKPKPNPAIAGQVEQEFKERWVQRRVGELMAAGQAADALQARRMAQDEFKKRYEYISDKTVKK